MGLAATQELRQVPALWSSAAGGQGCAAPNLHHTAGLRSKKRQGPGSVQAPAAIEASQVFEAGRLHYFLNEWNKITSDSVILDIVAGCHFDIMVDDINHLFSQELEYRFNDTETHIISEEIDKLLRLKVIQITERKVGQVISPIFLRRKKNGEHRLVLNLEQLNKYIPYKHFKLENFEQAIQLVNKGDFLASIDLQHAYYSVKVAVEHQRFLCFTWQGVIYQFTCMPNGIAEGPRLFTKLMKPVFAKLRERGFTITSYIDDSLICHSSRQGCLTAVKETIDTLTSLGFCIHEGKSVLVPTQRIEYLGNVIDTESMTVSLPVRRVDTIIQSCQALRSKTRERIREVARVTGLLVAATPAIELGRLHYRKLESAKIAALSQVNGDFDQFMLITEEMKTDLSWWLNNITSQCRMIYRPPAKIHLFTDASNTGWGGQFQHMTASGNWSSEERLLHINALEIKAILFALQAFTRELGGKHIKVLCDNTTAVNYVNEMGGTKSLMCNYLSSLIWDWCVEHQAWVTCSHIPGSENLLADCASRSFNDRHEWKLDERIFHSLVLVFGMPSIDLFASRLNYQVSTFCSWKPDPEAKFFDAFTLNWAQFDLPYIFPPFSLITRCLQKVRAEQARVWMVVPVWSTQPWMGMLLGLLVDFPRLIPNRKDVLKHPSIAGSHPVMQHTRLMACLLSGRACENRVFLQQAQTFCWHPGDRAQLDSTAHISLDGTSFVLDGVSIPLLPLPPTL